uniref:Uncharacterized protein n=1 Tax=Anguilla anguilla TaxID=7936 RepID=A0A0E9SG59_ANGAN
MEAVPTGPPVKSCQPSEVFSMPPAILMSVLMSVSDCGCVCAS